GYDGTLIFVSHDRYFVDALATKVWVLEDGAITAHVGNYTTYRTRRAQAEFVAQAQAQVEARAATAATRSATAETVRRQVSLRTVERVEAEIASMEERIAEIEGELSAASDEANV